MKIAVLALFLISQAGAASPTKTKIYEVKAEFIVKGKVVSAPGFIVRKNKLAHIEVAASGSKNLLKMDLTASEASPSKKNGLIHLKMKVDFKDKSNAVQASTLTDIEPGKSKVIPLSSSHGNVQIRVTADRKSL